MMMMNVQFSTTQSCYEMLYESIPFDQENNKCKYTIKNAVMLKNSNLWEQKIPNVPINNLVSTAGICSFVRTHYAHTTANKIKAIDLKAL